MHVQVIEEMKTNNNKIDPGQGKKDQTMKTKRRLKSEILSSTCFPVVFRSGENNYLCPWYIFSNVSCVSRWGGKMQWC